MKGAQRHRLRAGRRELPPGRVAGGHLQEPCLALDKLRAHPEWRDDPDPLRAPGRARGHVASPEERARLWPKVVAAYKGYEGYQRQTRREIPIVVLEPTASAHRAPADSARAHGRTCVRTCSTARERVAIRGGEMLGEVAANPGAMDDASGIERLLPPGVMKTITRRRSRRGALAARTAPSMLSITRVSPLLLWRMRSASSFIARPSGASSRWTSTSYQRIDIPGRRPARPPGCPSAPRSTR